MPGSSNRRTRKGPQHIRPSESAPVNDRRRRAMGGAQGRRKRKRPVPPTTVRGEPAKLRVRALAVPIGHEGGGSSLARRWECRLSPPESPPHPNAVFFGPAPRKLRLVRDHRLNEVPLAMRGRAEVRSSRQRAFRQNFRGASVSPDSSPPFSFSSSSAGRQLGSLPPRPSPDPPRNPPPHPHPRACMCGPKGRSCHCSSNFWRSWRRLSHGSHVSCPAQ